MRSWILAVALLLAGTANAQASASVVSANCQSCVLIEQSISLSSTVQFGTGSTNHATFAGATTGNPVTLTVDSSSGDSNVDISFAPKGSGKVSSAASFSTSSTGSGFVCAGTGCKVCFNSSCTVYEVLSTNDLILQTGGRIYFGNSQLSFNDPATGKFTIQATDSSGTPGAATINKPSGQSAIAAGASSVPITNSTVSSTSIVQAFLQATDGTCTSIKSVIPGAGTFTVNVNAACTGNTKFGWIVTN